MKKKILITGVNGFIGFNLFTNLSKVFNVYGIGTNKHYKRKKNSKIFNKNITKKNLLKLNLKPNIIIHCAGSRSVLDSYKDKKKDHQKNFETTKEVLAYCKTTSEIKKLIFISSAAVYGNYKYLNRLKPISPYGKNKLKAEKLCINYQKNNNIELAVLRLFSVYGIGLKKQLIWEGCQKLKKKKFLFFGTGSESRSWVHIKDVINAILLIIKDNKKVIIADIGDEKNIMVKDILSLICKNLKINPSYLRFNQKKKKGDPKYQKVLNKFIFKMGWKQSVSINNGIREYVSWFNNL